MIRVLVIAPYASQRAGLRAILSQSDEIEVTGEAYGSEDWGLLADSGDADAIVLDDVPPDGARVITLAIERGIPIVVLGEHPESVSELAKSPCGWAFLLKSARPEEIVAAIRGSEAGLAIIDRTVASQAEGLMPLRAEVDHPGSLTDRERDVLQLVARGLPNKVIAAKLQISQHTVKFHVASILSKLGASSRTEAVSIGVRNGLVSL